MGGLALGRLRSLLTLLVLVGLVLAGVAWGWAALTKPFPERVKTEICTETTIPAGTKVYPDQVLVNVANAGSTEGLADRTMKLLVDAGFAQGKISNAPDDAVVDYAEIWTDDPQNPAVRLLVGKLGKGVEVVRRDVTLPGINVIIGDDFKKLSKGGKWTKSPQDAKVCVAPTTGASSTSDSAEK